MDKDGADAETNWHRGDVSTACLVADEGSLGASETVGSSGLEAQLTSGALLAYHTRSKRLCLEKETYELQVDVPEDVASYVRTVRPVSKLPPRLMAALLVVTTAGASTDQAVIGVPEPGAIELIAAVHKKPLHMLVSKWRSLRQHGLGTAFLFRYQGKFTQAPSGICLCDEHKDVIDGTMCTYLREACVLEGTKRSSVGFYTDGLHDRTSKLRWLWLVTMPCRQVNELHRNATTVILEAAVKVMMSHLSGVRQVLFKASLELYKSKGAGCLSMFVNHYCAGELSGAPLHVDSRCVHGTVVINLSCNNEDDQLTVCTSPSGSGRYYTRLMHLVGGCATFGPGVVHGVNARKRQYARFTLNVFF
jgi:hypothetical protein